MGDLLEVIGEDVKVPDSNCRILRPLLTPAVDISECFSEHIRRQQSSDPGRHASVQIQHVRIDDSAAATLGAIYTQLGRRRPRLSRTAWR
jgi:hypothetical protein